MEENKNKFINDVDNMYNCYFPNLTNNNCEHVNDDTTTDD